MVSTRKRKRGLDLEDEHESSERKSDRISAVDACEETLPKSVVEAEPKRLHNEETDGSQCPYLDTIDRKLLDFDFEKICSISLSKHNVYGCLVCGKYLQGRGPRSHAYIHALQEDHHMFINLDSGVIFCLPEGYQVEDASLEDIHSNLHPHLSLDMVRSLDDQVVYSQALDGGDYLPGVIGLNNIKQTDWINALIQSLMRVRPLRDFFVSTERYSTCKSALVHTFGELVRKFWNPRLYRAHVSPHELLQEISTASDRQFRIGEVVDPIKFLSWFLNRLHSDLTGDTFGRRKKKSIITEVFQGTLRIESSQESVASERTVEDLKKSKFLYLSLELPISPLFKDVNNESMIPQVPLFVLLERFNGEKSEVFPDGTLKRYSLLKLPRYLIVHFRRFTKNNFFLEKNSTIVNFPITGLDLKDYTPAPTVEHLEGMSVGALKSAAFLSGIDIENCVEKTELIARISAVETLSSRYNLVSSLCHEGEPGKVEGGFFHAHIWNRSNKQWYDVQDLHVQETMPQLVPLSESYIQIWERASEH